MTGAMNRTGIRFLCLLVQEALSRCRTALNVLSPLQITLHLASGIASPAD